MMEICKKVSNIIIVSDTVLALPLSSGLQEGDGCAQFDTLSYECAPYAKGSETADPDCNHDACAYITCKKICNQTRIDENPVDPVTAPSGCNAYQNPEGASYEYRCFAALPILPDERGQGGHGPGSATADHTPPTTSKTPLIVVGSLIMLAAIWPCVNIMKRCRVQAGRGFEPLESGIIATLNENFVGNDHDYGDDEEEDDDVFTRDGADGGADKSSIRPEGLQRSPALPMRGSTDA
eukprot:gene8139-15632_t